MNLERPFVHQHDHKRGDAIDPGVQIGDACAIISVNRLPLNWDLTGRTFFCSSGTNTLLVVLAEGLSN